jgi:hypothetical protein
MITKYDFDERVSICMESGVEQNRAEEIAARQFFKSCNCPTVEDLERGYNQGFGKLKTFRTMNRGGLERWMQ